MLKRIFAVIFAAWATVAGAIDTPLTAVTGTITTQNLVPTGTCTPGSCVEIDVTGIPAVTVQVTGTYSGALSAQITTNRSVWVTECSSACTSTFTRRTTGVSSATITSGEQDIYQVQFANGAKRLRITGLAAMTGTANITIQPSDVGGGGSTSISGATDGVTQGSTTSGQSGVLVQGAVTTSAPSYTNAQTSPLSLDTSGNLRVNVVAGGAGGGNVTGGTAHDAVGTSVNPVLIGAYASAAAPTNVSADGDAVRAWYLRSGAAAVQPTLGGVLASAGSGANGTGVQRVTIATDDTIVASLATKLDTLHTDITAANSQLPSALGQTTMSGSLSTALASNQSAVALWGHGVLASTAPTSATLAGAKSGANMVAITQGSTTVKIDTASATTAELVALTSSSQIRITSASVVAGGTGTIKFVYGTGTNCGTGTTDLTGAYPLVANAGLSIGGGLGAAIVVPASQALCITTTGAVQMSGHVTYAKYAD